MILKEKWDYSEAPPYILHLLFLNKRKIELDVELSRENFRQVSDF